MMRSWQSASCALATLSSAVAVPGLSRSACAAASARATVAATERMYAQCLIGLYWVAEGCTLMLCSVRGFVRDTLRVHDIIEALHNSLAAGKAAYGAFDSASPDNCQVRYRVCLSPVFDSHCHESPLEVDTGLSARRAAVAVVACRLLLSLCMCAAAFVLEQRLYWRTLPYGTEFHVTALAA